MFSRPVVKHIRYYNHTFPFHQITSRYLRSQSNFVDKGPWLKKKNERRIFIFFDDLFYTISTPEDLLSEEACRMHCKLPWVVKNGNWSPGNEGNKLLNNHWLWNPISAIVVNRVAFSIFISIIYLIFNKLRLRKEYWLDFSHTFCFLASSSLAIRAFSNRI